MSIDKFGRFSVSLDSDVKSSTLMLSHRGFVFTKDGNIDIERLKLCNVQLPTENEDAANKKYVDDKITSFKSQFNTFKTNISQLTSDLNEQKKSLATVRKNIEQLKAVVTAIDKNIESQSVIKVNASASEVSLHEKH